MSSTVNFLVLAALLKKKIGSVGAKEIVFSFARIVFVSLLMGVGVCFANNMVSFSFLLNPVIENLFSLVFSVLYVLLALTFKIPEMRQLVFYAARNMRGRFSNGRQA